MYNFPWIKDVNNEYVFYYRINRSIKGLFKLPMVIRFSDDYIRFYLHNEDTNNLTFPENQQIFSMDLSSPKTIGNDILAISPEKIAKQIYTILVDLISKKRKNQQ